VKVVQVPVNKKPMIRITAQQGGGQVIVDEAYLDRKGFIGLHAVNEGGIGEVIGFSEIFEGVKKNVMIVVPADKVQKDMVLMLRYDNGDGLPEASEVDSPVKADRQIIISQIIYGSQESVTTTSSSSTSSSNPESVGTFLAKKSDIPPGETLDLTYNGNKIILINFNGEYRAYRNFCNHRGGPVKLESDKIVCQWHGSEFAPLSGSLEKGPATKSLDVINVFVDGDSVYAE